MSVKNTDNQVDKNKNKQTKQNNIYIYTLPDSLGTYRVVMFDTE